MYTLVYSLVHEKVDQAIEGRVTHPAVGAAAAAALRSEEAAAAAAAAAA
jgi:hypothetical protein